MAQISKAERAAQHLFEAHRERRKYEALPDDISPATIHEAYDMQEAFQALLAPQRGAIVGYKIALTTPVMQRMVGFDEPAAGAVFENGVHYSPASVGAADFVRIGAECEVAVRLSADLPASGAPYGREGVAGAVGALMPAFELVDDRGADYSNLYFLGVAADNAWNAGVVLGQERTDWRSAGEGYGRDGLGHPLDALAWLANALAGRGKELKAGMLVMTGSIVSTKFLNPGDEAAFTFEGLGDIRLSVG
ncbi:2-keto-4-pentenoate hydratase [Geodia barretti]|uniref:2-keto-4-pentenoate hydratase n=1 Tax=Geodia barretti TaxID=519541 RepID=A0AA35W0J6_GEOBA|nr:2-keto-4-pentenoate hydratase [Geodia barretti]